MKQVTKRRLGIAWDIAVEFSQYLCVALAVLVLFAFFGGRDDKSSDCVTSYVRDGNGNITQTVTECQ